MKWILTILTLTITTLTTGQNLVPNHSFEDTLACPTWDNQVYNAYPWFNATIHSPDYYNACSDSIVDVPQNYFGFQNARTGVAYTGIGVAQYSGSREYIEIKLTNSLTSGIDYCVEFYVSLADSCNIATDDIGAYLSLDSVFANTTSPLPHFPQIENPSGFLTNKSGWTLVSGQFTATGGEQYLVIGNFKDDILTDTISVAGGGSTSNPNFTGSYYYIDDIFVTPCDSLNALNEISFISRYKLYPNPNSHRATLEFENARQENHTLTIYDTKGQLVKTLTNIITEKIIIETDDLTGGLYFFQLRNDRQVRFTGKLTKE